MKILSLTAPWGTLISIGAKKIETRSWSTSYRGELAIHQAKGLVPIGGKRGFAKQCAEEPFNSVLTKYLETFDGRPRDVGDSIPLGAIVCVVNLIACRYTQGEYGSMPAPWIAELSEQEKAFGGYGPDRYGWFLEDMKRVWPPIYVPGQQGLRPVLSELEDEIRERVTRYGH